MKYTLLPILIIAFSAIGCQAQDTYDADHRNAAEGKVSTGEQTNNDGDMQMFTIEKSDSDWEKELTAEEYRVLREKGTEPAFTGKYDKHDERGVYRCSGCGNELFTSEGKFDSGCGWPSFYTPKDNKNLVIQKDYSHGMVRDEVLCAACGGHLGHLFDDGPRPTGLRYCINSVSLDFEAENK